MVQMKEAKLSLGALLITCLTLFAGRAQACMVCLPFPEATVADHLLNAQVVVLARENPRKPFSYLAVEVLKGDLTEPEIDLFLDTGTRRLLAANPDRSVVLALNSAKSPSARGFWAQGTSASEPSAGSWRSLNYASPRYEALVRDILAQAARWRESVGRETRATYFFPYLADTERSIRELAYLEVGRASYQTIRKADSFVPSDQLRVFLADPKYLKWHPLYILLLGVDAQPEDEKQIRAAMASLSRLDYTLNLSAWATALIEIDRQEAIAWLETAYLGDSDREPETVLEILKALSVQGAGASGLRGRILESYGVVIREHPSLAGWVARDLVSWNKWRFADALEEVRESNVPMDSASAYMIDYYTRQARSRLSH
ncbi:MAG: hypothetical protein R3193_15695 [Marinobacter sp.]|nr:hypothetical protein [Marinobacter sp.]